MKDQKVILENLLNELMDMSSKMVEIRALASESQAEAETLRLQVAQYQALFENLPQRLFLKGPNLVYRLCSRAYANFLNLKPSEISGKTDLEILPPEVAERKAAVEKKVLALGQPEEALEKGWPGKPGTVIRRQVFPLRSELGEVTGIFGMEEDVSPAQLPSLEAASAQEMESLKKQLQQETLRRQQAEEAWQKSEAGLKQIAEENRLGMELRRIAAEAAKNEEIFDCFAAEARKIISFDRLMIVLESGVENQWVVSYSPGPEVKGRQPGDIVPLEGSLEGDVFRLKGSLLLQKDHPEDTLPRFQQYLPFFKDGFPSLLIVPLTKGKAVIGALHFLGAAQNAYTEEDRSRAERIGALLAEALDQSQLKSELKRMKDKGQEQQARWRSFLEQSPQAIFTLDLSGSVVDANPAACRLLGFPREEFALLPLAALSSSEEIQKAREMLPLILRGELREFLLTFRRKQGEPLALRLVPFPLQSLGDTPVVHLLALEPEAQARVEGIGKKILSKYEPIIGFAPIGIWIYLDGKLQFANPKCSEILGYSAEELTSQPFARFLFADDRKMVLERYAGWLSGKNPPDVFVSRFLHREGYVKWLESKVALTTWEGKRAIIHYIRDITDFMNSREALRGSVEQLRTLVKCIEDIIDVWKSE